ncbi:hypothetical protein B0F90DRAFT_1718229 [Multifurca ochricompacta]|uniref:RRM domain-containing protein n=1 Tax=Multifurca ochricompacta TaxID=376703 RepID=A0AAD4M6L5_9AGAM|nr:hypothetical protein B0F90DRAFT_1718229 [Multifurca ochricompacta]
MASLLERMNVDPTPGVGPIRAKTRRAGSAPYIRPPKGDINSPWKHDMYQQGSESGKSLSDRLGAPSRDAPPKMNFGSAAKALKEATGQSADKELSIRGASTRGNVVEVTGLVKGTTAEDVEAIFKRCGPVTQSSVKQILGTGDVTVRLTFKQEKDAREAVRVFDKQVADGRTLGVRVVGGVNASLSGRLSVGVVDGSVDALIETDNGSKMRSDDIISRDPEAAARAHILVAPPGTDLKDYLPSLSSRGRGRGRGRGRRSAGGGGRRERGDGKMDVD